MLTNAPANDSIFSRSETISAIIVEAQRMLATNPRDASAYLNQAVRLLGASPTDASIEQRAKVDVQEMLYGERPCAAADGPEQVDGPRREPTTNLGRARYFRRYALLPGSRTLLRDGAQIEIGGRAFDLLATLLEHRGSIVEKRKLMERVWPSTAVEEGNLRFQMACLRRTLASDSDLIKTIPGGLSVFLCVRVDCLPPALRPRKAA